MRFTVTAWHGESATMFYVLDNRADVVVDSFRLRESADLRAHALNVLNGTTANA